MGTAASSNVFLTWFAEWGQVAYIGIQMLFWVAIGVAALMIALQYKRYVTFKVGDAKVPAVADSSPETVAEPFAE